MPIMHYVYPHPHIMICIRQKQCNLPASTNIDIFPQKGESNEET